MSVSESLISDDCACATLPGTLTTVMDIAVYTGKTRALEDTLLAAESFEMAAERGFLLLQIDADGAAARTFRREALTLVQHVLGETEGTTSKRVDSSLKELNGLIKGMILSKSLSDVHALVAVLDEDSVMHVSHAGRAEAYVIRGNAASQITEYSRGKPSPTFIHIASGQLEPGDTVVLSTQRLLRTFTPAQLAHLAPKSDLLVGEIKDGLEADGEQAALVAIRLAGKAPAAAPERRKTRAAASSNPLASIMPAMSGALKQLTDQGQQFMKRPTSSRSRSSKSSSISQQVSKFMNNLWKDLRNPARKKRAHLLLIAGVLALFLIVWTVANLSSFQQRSQAKAQLNQLIEQANEDIRTAETRRIAGDFDSSNAILERAEESARQIIAHESGLYRSDALVQLDRIRAKREEINNVTRLSPIDMVNIATKKPTVDTIGFIGLGDEEFIVFDKQDLYRVLHNTVEDPDRLSEEELILLGTNFPRFQTRTFQVTGNSIIELISGQPTIMKTDDPAGWIAGKAMETYLRYLYILSPENNQIYKYERLSNRYGAPAGYNVNGELEDALDLAIDGDLYVLKENGVVQKLLRGEVQPFVIRHLPEGALETATKVYKAPEGHLYFLDPENASIVVTTDGGSTGEAAYVRQFVLEDEKIEELKDIWVDDAESNLYVLDKKRLYKIALR